MATRKAPVTFGGLPQVDYAGYDEWLNQQSPVANGQQAYQQAVGEAQNNGVLQRGGDTVGNGFFGTMKDSADAGFFSSLAGTARFAGEFSPFGGDTLNNVADYFDKRAEYNTPTEELTGTNYVAGAIGNAIGSGGAAMAQAAVVAGIGKAMGLGAVGGTALGVISKTPVLSKLSTCAEAMWKTPFGKMLIGQVAGSPFEAMAEGGNLITEMRQQGYDDDTIREAALTSAGYNMAWLTVANMLEAGAEARIAKGFAKNIGKEGALKYMTSATGLKEGAKRVGQNAMFGAVSEGAEEFGQNLIGNYAKGEEFNYDEAREAALQGAIGGAFLSGAGTGVNVMMGDDSKNFKIGKDHFEVGNTETAPDGKTKIRDYTVNGDSVTREQFNAMAGISEEDGQQFGVDRNTYATNVVQREIDALEDGDKNKATLERILNSKDEDRIWQAAKAIYRKGPHFKEEQQVAEEPTITEEPVAQEPVGNVNTGEPIANPVQLEDQRTTSNVATDNNAIGENFSNLQTGRIDDTNQNAQTYNSEGLQQKPSSKVRKVNINQPQNSTTVIPSPAPYKAPEINYTARNRQEAMIYDKWDNQIARGEVPVVRSKDEAMLFDRYKNFKQQQGINIQTPDTPVETPVAQPVVQEPTPPVPKPEPSQALKDARSKIATYLSKNPQIASTEQGQGLRNLLVNGKEDDIIKAASELKEPVIEIPSAPVEPVSKPNPQPPSTPAVKGDNNVRPLNKQQEALKTLLQKQNELLAEIKSGKKTVQGAKASFASALSKYGDKGDNIFSFGEIQNRKKAFDDLADKTKKQSTNNNSGEKGNVKNGGQNPAPVSKPNPAPIEQPITPTEKPIKPADSGNEVTDNSNIPIKEWTANSRALPSQHDRKEILKLFNDYRKLFGQMGIDVVVDLNECINAYNERVSGHYLKLEGDELIQYNKATDEREGPLAGFRLPGVNSIYVNTKYQDMLNIAIHEYTHLWFEKMRDWNDGLYYRGLKLLKETKMWEDIKNDPRYKDLKTDEAIASEVLARLSGYNGELESLKLIMPNEENNVIEKLHSYLQDVFKEFKRILDKFTGKDLNDLTLEKFINMPLIDLLNAKPLNLSTASINNMKNYKGEEDVGHKEGENSTTPFSEIPISDTNGKQRTPYNLNEAQNANDFYDIIHSVLEDYKNGLIINKDATLQEINDVIEFARDTGMFNLMEYNRAVAGANIRVNEIEAELSNSSSNLGDVNGNNNIETPPTPPVGANNEQGNVLTKINSIISKAGNTVKKYFENYPEKKEFVQKLGQDESLKLYKKTNDKTKKAHYYATYTGKSEREEIPASVSKVLAELTGKDIKELNAVAQVKATPSAISPEFGKKLFDYINTLEGENKTTATEYFSNEENVAKLENYYKQEGLRFFVDIRRGDNNQTSKPRYITFKGANAFLRVNSDLYNALHYLKGKPPQNPRCFTEEQIANALNKFIDDFMSNPSFATNRETIKTKEIAKETLTTRVPGQKSVEQQIREALIKDIPAFNKEAKDLSKQEKADWVGENYLELNFEGYKNEDNILDIMEPYYHFLMNIRAYLSDEATPEVEAMFVSESDNAVTQAKIDEAKEMKAQKKSPLEILEKTNSIQIGDGEWRHITTDKPSDVNFENLLDKDGTVSKDSTTVGEIFNGPVLKDHPELKDVKVEVKDKPQGTNEGAHFDPNTNTIVLYKENKLSEDDDFTVLYNNVLAGENNQELDNILKDVAKFCEFCPDGTGVQKAALETYLGQYGWGKWTDLLGEPIKDTSSFTRRLYEAVASATGEKQYKKASEEKRMEMIYQAIHDRANKGNTLGYSTKTYFLHELQHAVQHIEGTPTGAMMDFSSVEFASYDTRAMMSKQIAKSDGELGQQYLQVIYNERKAYWDYSKKDIDKAEYETYKKALAKAEKEFNKVGSEEGKKIASKYKTLVTNLYNPKDPKTLAYWKATGEIEARLSARLAKLEDTKLTANDQKIYNKIVEMFDNKGNKSFQSIAEPLAEYFWYKAESTEFPDVKVLQTRADKALNKFGDTLAGERVIMMLEDTTNFNDVVAKLSLMYPALGYQKNYISVFDKNGKFSSPTTSNVQTNNVDLAKKARVTRSSQGKSLTEKIENVKKDPINYIKEKLKELWHKLYTDWIDRNHGFELLDKKVAEKLKRELSDAEKTYFKMHGINYKSAGMAEGLLLGRGDEFDAMNKRLRKVKMKHRNGTMATVMDNVTDKKLNNATAQAFMNKYGFKDGVEALGEVLTWKRLRELYTMFDEAHDEWEKNGQKGEEPKMRDIPNDLTAKELDQLIASVPEQFNKACEDYYAMNDNILSILEDGGVITSDLHTLLNKHKNYCPLQRDFSDTQGMDDYLSGFNSGGSGAVNVSNSIIKKMTKEGSKRYVVNPLEVTVSATHMATRRAERNKAALHFVKLATLKDENGNNMMDDVVQPRWHWATTEAEKKKGEKVVKNGKIVGFMIKDTARVEDSTFSVMEDGIKKTYWCDPMYYEDLTDGNPETSGMLWNFMSMFAKVLRFTATKSPSFIIRNGIRDTFTAATATDVGFKPLVDTFDALKTLHKKEENLSSRERKLLALFRVSGISTRGRLSDGQEIYKSLQEMVKDKNMNFKDPVETVKRLWDYYDTENTYVEQAPRLKLLELSLEENLKKVKNRELTAEEIKNGYFEDELVAVDAAIRTALRGTTDFGRLGKKGQKVNQVVPFFNATLQGVDIFANNLANPKTRNATIYNIGKYLVLPSIAIFAANADKDWWKETDPQIKYSNWLISEDFRVPVPQEAGVMFAGGIMAFLDKAYNNDPKSMQEWFRAFRGNLVPNFIPTAISPILEWQANYSFFTHRNIVSQRLQKLPDELQYDTGTPDIIRGIGKATGQSPKKIQALVRGYLATLGDYGVRTLDIPYGLIFGSEGDGAAKKPGEYIGVRDFNVTDSIRTRYSNDFYDMLKEAQKQHAGYGKKGKPSADLKSLNAASRVASSYMQDIRKIEVDKSLSKERRRELIDEKRAKMNAVFKKAVEKYGPKYL